MSLGECLCFISPGPPLVPIVLDPVWLTNVCVLACPRASWSFSPSLLLSTESKDAGCPASELLLGPVERHTENPLYLPRALFFMSRGEPELTTH